MVDYKIVLFGYKLMKNAFVKKKEFYNIKIDG